MKMKTDFLPCAVKTVSTLLKTEIGVFEIVACETGLHKIEYKGSDTVVDNDADHLNDLSSPVHRPLLWMKEYFEQNNKNIKSLEFPKICWAGLGKTDFEIQVWKGALEHVKFGETMAYSELATVIERPSASRAVGTALKKNPIIILIPCHRIIKADGTFGKYAGGGSTNKDWLLKFEKAN